MADLFKDLDIGLSQFVRYFFGGFLLFTIVFWFWAPDLIDRVKCLSWEKLPWETVAMGVFLAGVAVYSIHRGVVIPVHHGMACLGWAWWDTLRQTEAKNSTSPTRWLGSIGVNWWNRIPSYTAIRRSDFFGERKVQVDLAHTENGLVVMLFEASLVFTIYTKYHHDKFHPTWPIWSLGIVTGGLLFVTYITGVGQHRAECLEMKARKPEVTKLLRERGLLNGSESCNLYDRIRCGGGW